MVAVVVRDGKINQALASLKRKLSRDHTSAEMRIRAFAKPSERRRRKELEAERLRKKMERRRQYRAEENQKFRKKSRPVMFAEEARKRQATSGPGVYGGKPAVENLPQVPKARDQAAALAETYDRLVVDVHR